MYRSLIVIFICLILLSGCNILTTSTLELTTVRGTESNAAAFASSFRTWTTEGLESHTSMLPYIQSGDTFVSVRFPYESLKSGQVVAFQTLNGQIVVHKLNYLTKNGWITDGINNPNFDSVRMTDDNYRGVIILNFRPTLNIINTNVNNTMKVAADLYHNGKLTEAQRIEIATFYNHDFLPVYNIAVTKASFNLSNFANADLTKLSIDFAALVNSYQTTAIKVYFKFGEQSNNNK